MQISIDYVFRDYEKIISWHFTSVPDILGFTLIEISDERRWVSKNRHVFLENTERSPEMTNQLVTSVWNSTNQHLPIT